MPTQTSKTKISLFSFNLLLTLGKKLSQKGMKTKETWVPSISLTPPQPTDSKKSTNQQKKIQHFVTSVHGHDVDGFLRKMEEDERERERERMGS